QGLVQFPTALGSVVPAVNLSGIASGELTLSGPVLAAIYLGRIRRWNAPAIAKLNPGLDLPSRPIAVVYRADGSGTTFIFTRYLARVSAAWKRQIGVGKAVAWPRGIGGKGNEGVAAYVKHIPGAIGYVEYAYVLATHMTAAALINRAGKRVQASPKSFAAAAANARWSDESGFDVRLIRGKGADGWPLLGATYALVPARPRNPAATHATLAFFAWAWRHGDALAARLAYSPLPAPAVRLIKRSWHAHIRADGKPLWPLAAASTAPAASSAP
ncbi:MAG: phosphate ABC transporter substrate-binding protein PstS, partial [Gammaproteobacteria bacterium]